MPRARVCSECGKPLAGKPPQTKTCGQTCRSKRSRRLRRVKRENGEARALPEHQRVLAEAVRDVRDEVVSDLVQREIQPVVREAITEDVMRSIADLVALTPDVVSAIAEDLHSDDATIRQRAYTLVAKWTIGHPAIINRDDDPAQKQLIVNFELPRPEAPEPVPVEAEVSPAGARPCDVCGEDKTEDAFVDGSDRCRDCWAKQRQLVEERFGAD